MSASAYTRCIAGYYYWAASQYYVLYGLLLPICGLLLPTAISVVCRSLTVIDEKNVPTKIKNVKKTAVSPAKMVKPIKMPFGYGLGWAQGSMN